MEDPAIFDLQHLIKSEQHRDPVTPLVASPPRHAALLQELAQLASRLAVADEEIRTQREELDSVRGQLRAGLALQAGPDPQDLLAEDLATFALDVAQEHSAVAVLGAITEAVVGLVPGASQVVVSLLRHSTVELSSATGPGAESCDAWQLALRSGPAVTASEEPGVVVLVDDLTTDPRWTHLQVTGAREGLASVASVAAALPTSTRTLVLSWYSASRSAFTAPDCARVALLATAHASVALDRALHEDNLHAAIAHRQEIGEAVGILAAQESVTREAAFALLRVRSQRTNQRLADVAGQVVQEHG